MTQVELVRISHISIRPVASKSLHIAWSDLLTIMSLMIIVLGSVASVSLFFYGLFRECGIHAVGPLFFY